MSKHSKTPRERAEEVAAAIEGTCDNLLEHAHEALTDDPDFCETLDDLVFCCDQCGWWSPIEEREDDGEGGTVCADCLEENAT